MSDEKKKPNEKLCWCGHTEAQHDGPDGMCRFNEKDDCGGFDAP